MYAFRYRAWDDPNLLKRNASAGFVGWSSQSTIFMQSQSEMFLGKHIQRTDPFASLVNGSEILNGITVHLGSETQTSGLQGIASRKNPSIRFSQNKDSYAPFVGLKIPLTSTTIMPAVTAIIHAEIVCVASCAEIATPRSAWLTIHPLPLNGQYSTFEKDR